MEAPVKFELVDINEILKTLPHRYPMLLIDRVIKIRSDYSGIGVNVRIGRDCNVGAHTAIQCALIGDNVLIHPGCSIGQDGYGFVFFGPDGHLKVPQTGRVLIQNDVEIGAGTTIDRGSLRDTVIGEGTKIDNQVQIGRASCRERV